MLISASNLSYSQPHYAQYPAGLLVCYAASFVEITLRWMKAIEDGPPGASSERAWSGASGRIDGMPVASSVDFRCTAPEVVRLDLVLPVELECLPLAKRNSVTERLGFPGNTNHLTFEWHEKVRVEAVPVQLVLQPVGNEILGQHMQMQPVHAGLHVEAYFEILPLATAQFDGIRSEQVHFL